jgi:type IV pilus assembly protein PilN
LEKTKKDLSTKVNLIQQLKSKQESTVRMMDEISNALPEWVWLTSLGFSGNIVRLSGKALNNDLIANFINNLKATDSFTNVDFKKSSRKKQSKFEDIFTFSLTCQFKEKSTEKKAG